MKPASPSVLARIAPVLFLSVAVGCGGEDAPRDEHGHAESEAEHSEAEAGPSDEAGHAAEGGRTDPHHVAEQRLDCEDDVLLPEGALERYGIEIAAVQSVRLAPTITAPGHLGFPQGAVTRVGSAVAGRVLEVRALSGDAVTKGAPLLVIESVQLGEAQSDYLHKQTVALASGPAVEFAQDAYERAQQLFDSVQGIAFSEVQRREAEFRQAERERTLAIAAESAARNRLQLLGLSEASLAELESTGRVEPRFTILAPLTGRVAEVAVTVGQMVEAEQDSLMVIGNFDKLWAIAEVSESRLAEVAVGARARVRVDALSGWTAESVVTSIAPILEASMRTVEVRMDVPNLDGRLLPGMFVSVEIESNTRVIESMLALPDAAVLDIEGSPSVFMPIDDAGRKFCKHAVRVGKPVGELIPVLGGLQAGDLVVVAGAFRLKAEHGRASATHDH
ncbi:MAG: efflux RND transporter periplasmic adaptor subunit [Planctomycetota bacterium]